MSHGKLCQPQRRSFKDPDLGRSSRSIAMTDAEFAEFTKAAMLSDMDRGPFVAMLAREWLTLHELRQAEKNNFSA